jgi:hypothetical protein
MDKLTFFLVVGGILWIFLAVLTIFALPSTPGWNLITLGSLVMAVLHALFLWVGLIKSQSGVIR